MAIGVINRYSTYNYRCHRMIRKYMRSTIGTRWRGHGATMRNTNLPGTDGLHVGDIVRLYLRTVRSVNANGESTK